MRVRELQFSVKERLLIGQSKTGYKKDEREKKEKEDEKERSKNIRQKNKNLIRHVRKWKKLLLNCIHLQLAGKKYAFSVAILISSHSMLTGRKPAQERWVGEKWVVFATCCRVYCARLVNMCKKS